MYAQSSKSFEVRYFTPDKRANGETDFRGPTEVLTTDQRIDFLRHYADFSKSFFEDQELSHMVVSDKEAIQAAGKIKPQPQPQHRNNMLLDSWKWVGYRQGQELEKAQQLAKFGLTSNVQVAQGVLNIQPNSGYTWKFPSQSWRFSFTWKAKVANSKSETSFVFSELEKITGVELGFGENGKFFYTTADNKRVETSAYQEDTWYDFKIEFDLAAFKRKEDVVRYNLYIDGILIADYVPLQRVVMGGVGYAQNFTSIAKINRLTVEAGSEVTIDDIWGVGYHLTGRESYPYTVETFLDEDFDFIQGNAGWQNLNFEDTLWHEATLPFAHGSERNAEEDLYLRKVVEIDSFDKAYLNLETLDPGGEVWVNGQLVAVFHDRAPKRLDISDFLKKGERNILAVKVNHFYLTEKVGEIMPHSSLDFNVGWFAGRMSLDLVNYTHIHDVFVHTTSIEGTSATELAKVKINNKYWGAFRGTLEVKMYPWFPQESSQIAAEGNKQLLLSHNVTEVEIPLEVTNAKLWTPDEPNLYKVHFVLKDESGEVIDDYVTTTGIRTVDQEGGSFRLNGEVSMLNGAQIMGYRGPVEKMITESRCAPEDWIAKEILQIKRMNGNLMRVHVHNWEFPARGINDPRYAEFADQMGIMLLWCPTSWIRTGRGWGDVDFENYPKYMQQVINHPSIVMWEAANHTQSFKGKPVSESNLYCEQVHNTLYPVDPSRIISYNSFVNHFHYANDDGTIDHDGNTIDPGWAWTAPNVTRGNQDSPTGYGKTWNVLRNYPGDTRASFLDSKERAYFNFEHQESIGQPNWNLVKGKPWYHMHSYEWSYDEGCIGRRLMMDEWEESQAWQGFGAWEAMKKMRFLDYDGFSWCCLHGGANSVTYKKPLIDFLGHAKIAWHVNKMIFQKTVAGTGNVDIAIGPDDEIEPIILNWNEKQTVDLTIKVLDDDQNMVTSKTYNDVMLEGGRTVKELQGFKPEGLAEGFYYIVYEIN